MDAQWIINGLLVMLGVIGGWFLRTLWASVQRLTNDLNKLEVHMAEHYVKRDDLKEAMREIKEMVSKIFDKLDGKADK